MLINSENSFNGSVKEVKTRTISLFDRDGKVEENLESTDYILFDSHRNLLESQRFYSKKQTVKTINNYNENNRKISSLFYSNGLLINKYEFIYNDEGKLIELKYFDENGNFVSNSQPVYTKENLRIEEAVHEPILSEGKTVRGIISFAVAPEIRIDFTRNEVNASKTTYDAKDKLIEVSFYKKRNRLLGKIFVIYDDKERPFKIIKYGDNSSRSAGKANLWQKMFAPLVIKLLTVILKAHSVYLLSRNREYKKAALCFKYGAPFSQTKIEYDEDEREVQLSSLDSFNFDNQVKTIFRYDENGNLIEKKSLPDDSYYSVRESHEYEYDWQNNWIKKKSLYKMPIGDMTGFMERVVLTTRTIKYF